MIVGDGFRGFRFPASPQLFAVGFWGDPNQEVRWSIVRMLRFPNADLGGVDIRCV